MAFNKDRIVFILGIGYMITEHYSSDVVGIFLFYIGFITALSVGSYWLFKVWQLTRQPWNIVIIEEPITTAQVQMATEIWSVSRVTGEMVRLTNVNWKDGK